MIYNEKKCKGDISISSTQLVYIPSMTLIIPSIQIFYHFNIPIRGQTYILLPFNILTFTQEVKKKHILSPVR